MAETAKVYQISMRQPPQNTAHLSKTVANKRLLIILRRVLAGEKQRQKRKGSISATTQAMRPQAKKRKKEESAMLDREEMEELSAWIFIAEQACKQC